MVVFSVSVALLIMSSILYLFNLLYHMSRPIIFVSASSVMLTFFVVIVMVLQMLNILPTYYVLNINYLMDIFYLVITNVFVNCLLIKDYQEIAYKYNKVSLSIVFGTLSIIFGQLIEIYRAVGVVNSGILIIVTMLVVITDVLLISNVYLTSIVKEIINYDDVDIYNDFEHIVSRKININGEKITATYVANRNNVVIDKKAKLKIVFYYIIAIIWFCF